MIAKIRSIGLCASLLLSILALASRTVAQADRQLVLRANMVSNEEAIGGDPSAMVDEQTTVGDPALGTGTRPSSPFFAGWTKWQYPLHYLVDLGAKYHVTRIYFYNDTGGAPITISTGVPFSWTDIPSQLSGYHCWDQVDIGENTQFLRLTFTQPTGFSEILVYVDGSPIPVSLDQPVVAVQPQVSPDPMDTFIGANAFIDDPVDKLSEAVGYVREYHNWSWDTEAADHQLRFQPSGAAGGNSWFFDDYYRKLLAYGATVTPAIQGNDPIFFPGTSNSDRPTAVGADPNNPQSYLVHAQELFQYAARYGSRKVPLSDLRLGADQPRLTGLQLLQSVENWNEPDATWAGSNVYFTPYEMAAMCSADYDGDQGRLGSNAGVHTADPTMKLVLGGLSRDRLDYLRSMVRWAKHYRNGSFPADVINFHHYSSDAGDAGGFKTTGISPEADNLKERFTEIVNWCHKNIPGRSVWVTEFGYDTNPNSPLHAPAIGRYSAEEVQGCWLVRTYLALASSGIDRAAMYMFRDTGLATDPGVFATSGLVTQKGEWREKPSYFYVATLRHWLTGMYFVKDLTTPKLRADSVLLYNFKSKGTAAADVIWCGSSTDHAVADVPVSIPYGLLPTVIELSNDSPIGKVINPHLVGGTLLVNVTERPVIVVY